jgi:hypothetical protein
MGFPGYVWMLMFHDCHEKVYDGAMLRAKHGKKLVIQSFMFRRIEWPAGGRTMEQDNRQVEIFSIIADEYERILASKVKSA